MSHITTFVTNISPLFSTFPTVTASLLLSHPEKTLQIYCFLPLWIHPDIQQLQQLYNSYKHYTYLLLTIQGVPDILLRHPQYKKTMYCSLIPADVLFETRIYWAPSSEPVVQQNHIANIIHSSADAQNSIEHIVVNQWWTNPLCIWVNSIPPAHQSTLRVNITYSVCTIFIWCKNAK